MNDDEFEQFVQDASEELEQKQDALTKQYRLGKWEDFLYDAPSGRLQFKDKSGTVKVQAETISLGSHSKKSDTWQWAWANKSLPAGVRKQAEEVKQLFKLTGMDVFKQPTIEIDEGMAWELVAMCVKHLAAQGCYSMPADPTGVLRVFVAIREVAKIGK